LQKASAALSSLSGQTCLYKVCDVRDPAACKGVVDFALQHFGMISIIVNGAAGNFLAEAKNLSPKGFKTVSSCTCRCMAIAAVDTRREYFKLYW
jgi:peroxisomal 2,4-dienoyl-CoA reductase